MSFIYPAEVVEVIRDRWEALQQRYEVHRPAKGAKPRPKPSPRKRPAFPDTPQLKELVDVIYHASFLTEETRQLAARVGFLIPADCEKDADNNVLNSHDSPVALSEPRPFTTSEVMRITPALDPVRSMLAVCPRSAAIEGETSDDLVIWGILHLGEEWWRASTGRASGALCPPGCLTLSCFTPGNLTATTGGTVLLRLENGQLLGVPLSGFSEGHIGRFLGRGAEELYNAVITALSQKKYAAEADSDQHPRNQYYRLFENIVQFAAERRHGATFVVFPKEIEPDDQRLADRIALKYTINSPDIWNALIKESVATRRYFDLLFPKKNEFLTHKKHASAADLKSLISWEHQQDNAEEQMLDFQNFVAALSGVDGVVVLSTQCKVYGFGGEIIASSPTLRTVQVAHDADAKQCSTVGLNSFGTRHRSAFRLCSSFEDCVALIVSQDGATRAVKRIGRNVVLWNHVNLRNFGL